MSEIIFVLGAGASKDCGAPLMDDFLDTASQLHSKNQVGDKKEDFERVFQVISKLQTVHSKAQLDLNNIESIFTALEVANLLNKLPGFETEDIPLAISSLKELIVVTLEKTINYPTHGSRIQSTNSYQKFAELLYYINTEAHPKKSTSVVTFNYDIALDVAMQKNGLGPYYGFGPDVQVRCPIKLLKLHGSLNWAVKSRDNEVVPLNLEDYFSNYSYRGFGEERSSCNIPIGSQLQEYFTKNTSIEVSPEPVIVPPTWNKVDYHQLLTKIWGVTAKELEEAEYVFIIGYSLPETDAFFRLLYGLGTVGEKPFKKIIVYNPDQTDMVKNRFKKMMGPGALARFEYKPLTFNKSIPDIKTFFPKRD